MSFFASDEFHLLWAGLLNAAALFGAWRWARRFGDDRLEIAADTGLLYYLIQYLSVCLPGLLGALHPLTITLVAVLLSAAMALAGGRKRRLTESVSQSPPTPDSPLPDKPARWLSYAASDRPCRALSTVALAAGILFALGYVASPLWNQRQLPVLSNDALTYHLPAAVQWLQSGWIGLYPAWFYNPANSYSPLAGSVFMAWLMAPMGNDAMARFVQVGPMILLLIGMANICRRLGASIGGAGLIACALVLSRPFMSETILAKDDLFVAAFFVLTIDAMSRPRLEQRTGAWRIGTALGLLLATKYTVLLSLPILILMLGRGWTWRRLGIVALCVLILAGPWYLRNWILVGNPIYPTGVQISNTTIFRGMLNVHRSDLLATPRGVWNVFTGGYYGTTLSMAGVMIACWVGGLAVSLARRRGWQRLTRTCLVGPILGILLFIAIAPYGEMRFAYPSLVLIFAAGAIILSALPWAAQLALGVLMVLVAARTAFADPTQAMTFMLSGLVAAGFGVAGVLFWQIRVVRTLAVACAAVFVLMGTPTLMFNYTRMPAVDRLYGWQQTYGAVADVWNYAREEIPLGATIAYANTFFVYPLQGYDYSHRVIYAPTRRGLDRFTQMPAIEQSITGEQIVSRVCDLLRNDPDREQWLRRLRESGAAYLVVMKQDPARPDVTITPPELTFARQDPNHFAKVFENEAGTVFRIAW